MADINAMDVTIQVGRGSHSAWDLADSVPVPMNKLIYDTEARTIKRGDGENYYEDLPVWLNLTDLEDIRTFFNYWFNDISEGDAGKMLIVNPFGTKVWFTAQTFSEFISQLDLTSLLSVKANTGHTHTTTDITNIGTVASRAVGINPGNVVSVGADGKLNTAAFDVNVQLSDRDSDLISYLYLARLAADAATTLDLPRGFVDEFINTLAISDIHNMAYANEAFTCEKKSAFIGQTLSTTAGGDVATYGGSIDPIEAFSDVDPLDYATFWTSDDQAATVTCDFGEGNAFVIKEFSITAVMSTHSSSPNYAPSNFTIEGSNDGSNWDVLLTKTGETWTAGENAATKTYTTGNTTAYRYYRLDVTTTVGGLLLQLGQFAGYYTDTSITSTTFTATTEPKKARLFLRANIAEDLNNNFIAEMSRDGGYIWNPVLLKKQPMTKSGIDCYAGDCYFDSRVYTETLLGSAGDAEDIKGTITGLTIDTANISGHFNNPLLGIVGQGCRVVLNDGAYEITITGFSGTGINTNSVQFSGTIPAGTYTVTSIVSIITSGSACQYVNESGTLSTVMLDCLDTWTYLTSVAASYTGTAYLALFFGTEARVWHNETYVSIARYTNGVWQYLDATATWQTCTRGNTVQNAVSEALDANPTYKHALSELASMPESAYADLYPSGILIAMGDDSAITEDYSATNLLEDYTRMTPSSVKAGSMDRLLDGDLLTSGFWFDYSHNVPSWIMYDCGENVKAAPTYLYLHGYNYPGGGGYYAYTPKQFEIQGSHDGETWTTFYYSGEITYPTTVDNGNAFEVAFENTQAFRYLRVARLTQQFADTGNYIGYCALTELRLFGSKTSFVSGTVESIVRLGAVNLTKTPSSVSQTWENAEIEDVKSTISSFVVDDADALLGHFDNAINNKVVPGCIIRCDTQGLIIVSIDGDGTAAGSVAFTLSEEYTGDYVTKLIPQDSGTIISNMNYSSHAALAFDGIQEGTANTASAWVATTDASWPAYCGKQWDTAKVVTGMKTWAPTDAGYIKYSDQVTIELQGSNDGTSWTVLGTIPTFTRLVESQPKELTEAEIDTSTAYLYHRAVINSGSAYDGFGFTEIEFYTKVMDISAGTYTVNAINGLLIDSVNGLVLSSGESSATTDTIFTAVKALAVGNMHTITDIDISATTNSGNIYFMCRFGGEYKVHNGITWVTAVKYDEVWKYLNAEAIFVAAPLDTAESAISEAIKTNSSNRMTITVIDALSVSDYPSIPEAISCSLYSIYDTSPVVSNIIVNGYVDDTYNVPITKTFSWTSGEVENLQHDLTTFTVDSSSGDQLLSDVPTGITISYNYTLMNLTEAIPAGTVVTKLHCTSRAGNTTPMAIFAISGTEGTLVSPWYDNVTHSSDGWASVEIDPVTIPDDDNSYYVAMFTLDAEAQYGVLSAPRASSLDRTKLTGTNTLQFTTGKTVLTGYSYAVNNAGHFDAEIDSRIAAGCIIQADGADLTISAVSGNGTTNGSVEFIRSDSEIAITAGAKTITGVYAQAISSDIVQLNKLEVAGTTTYPANEYYSVKLDIDLGEIDEVESIEMPNSTTANTTLIYTVNIDGVYKAYYNDDWVDVIRETAGVWEYWNDSAWIEATGNTPQCAMSEYAATSITIMGADVLNAIQRSSLSTGITGILCAMLTLDSSVTPSITNVTINALADNSVVTENSMMWRIRVNNPVEQVLGDPSSYSIIEGIRARWTEEE